MLAATIAVKVFCYLIESCIGCSNLILEKYCAKFCQQPIIEFYKVSQNKISRVVSQFGKICTRKNNPLYGSYRHAIYIHTVHTCMCIYTRYILFIYIHMQLYVCNIHYTYKYIDINMGIYCVCRYMHSTVHTTVFEEIYELAKTFALTNNNTFIH